MRGISLKGYIDALNEGRASPIVQQLCQCLHMQTLTHYPESFERNQHIAKFNSFCSPNEVRRSHNWTKILYCNHQNWQIKVVTLSSTLVRHQQKDKTLSKDKIEDLSIILFFSLSRCAICCAPAPKLECISIHFDFDFERMRINN